MNGKSEGRRFKLAAIDLDGTLLGPDLSISGENHQAIHRLREKGVEIVIASGRHYASIIRILEGLPDIQWIISVQGGEVSDRERTRVLGRDFLDPSCVGGLLQRAAERGLTPVLYAPEGVFSPASWNRAIEGYQRLSGLTVAPISNDQVNGKQFFKIVWLGDSALVDAVMQDETTAPQVAKVRTHHYMVEFVPAAVSKASGLQTLVSKLNITPEECVVFGDGDNDIPMFEWAGLSVAMAHGWPKALEEADIVSAPGDRATALARGIETVLADYIR